MYKIILYDGTEIGNCLEGTTSDNVIHWGQTASEAASVLDEINPTNTVSIRVIDENGEEIAHGGDLILNPGAAISEYDEGGFTCVFTLRHKTEIEIMKDEISELQDIVMDL